MLGKILAGLTNATTAEAVVSAVGKPAILARIQACAAAGDVSVGALVATRVGHLVEHGAEDIWLDFLGLMSSSPQPGAAAVERMLTYAFPDPDWVRIKRNA